MNSEELEQSLRAEFESYLKGVFAEMREETAEFQKKIEAEFESQKARIDESFKAFSERFGSEHAFDEAFTEAVTEHLRLARDEGAQISARAFAEAEEMEKATNPEVNFTEIKEAINDISSKDSQSSILKSLIHHASNYTPRGAFFIIKNEHFVGWKVFGKEGTTGEEAIREIHFPISADSILGKAVTSLSTVEGSYGSFSDDSAFLEALEFGSPDRMYAIPLTARGRGVAVLYADYGHEGITLNTDALESLVKVAGMTVELLASSKTLRTVSETPAVYGHIESTDLNPTVDYSREEFESAISAAESETEVETETEFKSEAEVAEVEEVTESAEEPVESESFERPSVFTEPMPFGESAVSSFEPAEEVYDVQPELADETETATDEESGGFDFQPADETPGFATFEEDKIDEVVTSGEFDVERVSDEFESVSEAETVTETEAETDTHEAPPVFTPGFDIPESPVTDAAMRFDSHDEAEPAPFEEAKFETDKFETAPFDQQVDSFSPVDNGQSVDFSPAVEVETASTGFTPARSRLSDRNVDLPIEVAEDERRLHNDARRFARLLVSEIKLYNEKKVQEGREASDIYERLREAIDRSREMYDKRVQPAVAAKFDYFHYEVVNALGEGDEKRLGRNYPGSTV